MAGQQKENEKHTVYFLKVPKYIEEVENTVDVKLYDRTERKAVGVRSLISAKYPASPQLFTYFNNQRQ